MQGVPGESIQGDHMTLDEFGVAVTERKAQNNRWAAAIEAYLQANNLQHDTKWWAGPDDCELEHWGFSGDMVWIRWQESTEYCHQNYDVSERYEFPVVYLMPYMTEST